MKSLFEPETHQEIVNRLKNLSPESTPLWGKMTVGQMLAHCQFPLKIALSTKPRKRIWNPLPLLFKRSLYNDKPWRKNIPTAKKAKITDQRDFLVERSKLFSMIDAFYEKRNQTKFETHPFFGDFTPEQWGKLEYKHLDHHLKQFGV